MAHVLEVEDCLGLVVGGEWPVVHGIRSDGGRKRRWPKAWGYMSLAEDFAEEDGAI